MAAHGAVSHQQLRARALQPLSEERVALLGVEVEAGPGEGAAGGSDSDSGQDGCAGEAAAAAAAGSEHAGRAVPRSLFQQQ